jgi:hypothetical protein
MTPEIERRTEDFVSAEAKLTVIFDLPTGERYTLTIPEVVNVEVEQVWDTVSRTYLGVEKFPFLADALHRLRISVTPRRVPMGEHGARQGYFTLVKDLTKR